MATVEYDLNTSGGLMTQIQALIAPPASEEERRKPAPRRHRAVGGRAVNHDCCDSCNEGGDLICCDRCPATFHLQCHDPPLDEESLPSGEWICHRCSYLANAKAAAAAATASGNAGDASTSPCPTPNGTGPSPPSGSSSSVHSEPMLCEEASNSSSSSSGSSGSSSSSGGPSGSGGNALQLLVAAAAALNAQQFELPPELACHIALPGSSKRPRPTRGRRHDLEPLVPLPLRVCFTCRRSCRWAPLIQCDYCPLLFHADCLEYPLASLPTGRWMCPNHAENFLEEKLLSSVSLTERVRLWDRFGASSGRSPDQEAVKVAFLARAHRLRPPFRCQRQRPRLHRAHIPRAVRDHYRIRPPPLSPSLSSPSWVSRGKKREEEEEGEQGEEDEEELWLASLVALQLALAARTAAKWKSPVKEEGEQPCREAGFGRELGQLDERLVRLLAWQRLQQLLGSPPATTAQSLSTHEEEVVAEGGSGGAVPAPSRQRAVQQPRAVVCPVNARGGAVPMLYRTLTLGSGADMDVCLGDFGHCDMVSSKHACIFFDEISKHYELLNYSEHGTTVDNVLYSCDFSDKRSPTTATTLGGGGLRAQATAAAAPRSHPPPRTGVAVRRTCGCRTNPIGGAAGWEGTALLHHGSLIKLGCLQFVFSVASGQQPQPPLH